MERYTLHYTNHHGKEDWMDDWHPTKESLDFKTVREAKEYLNIMNPKEHAYIYDKVKKEVLTL